MPVIEFKTTLKLSEDQKLRMAAGFSQAFPDARGVKVSANVLVHIEDGQWIDFRGTVDAPSALAVIHPGPLTPPEDYRPIVKAFFDVLAEILPELPKERVYMTVSQIDHWGWNGALL